MASRNLLLRCAIEEIDDEFEDLFLHAALRSKQPAYRIGQFKGLRDFDHAEVKRMARLSIEDVQQLRIAYGLPYMITIEQERYTASGDNALFPTLQRLSYPCRLRDLAREFCTSKAREGAVFNHVVNFLYKTWHHLFGFLDSRFGREKSQRYAELIKQAGSPFRRCVECIDGTCRAVCRPIKNQRLLFSGHKRMHGVQFQSIVTPDEMISHLCGPFAGHRHDIALLNASGLLPLLKTHFRDEHGPFMLYGDAGNALWSNIVSAIKGARLTADQMELNRAMIRLRISVEWRFDDILRYFAFVDLKKKLKLYLQPAWKY